jgi:hypothetical protein
MPVQSRPAVEQDRRPATELRGGRDELKSSPDLRFGVGVHETTFRVNVRWVTPLGEETASTS